MRYTRHPIKNGSVVRAVTRATHYNSDYWYLNLRQGRTFDAHFRNVMAGQTFDRREQSNTRMALRLHGSVRASVLARIQREEWEAERVSRKVEEVA
jgi:hypothetical protein